MSYELPEYDSDILPILGIVAIIFIVIFISLIIINQPISEEEKTLSSFSCEELKQIIKDKFETLDNTIYKTYNENCLPKDIIPINRGKT